MKRLAIVGAGIAGLGSAYYLKDHFDLTVFEQADYAGGHSNTITVQEGQTAVPIDTGFMVFNQVTYPNLIKLFNDLSVPVKPTDMSFSVQNRKLGLEWSGTGLRRVLCTPRNLFDGRFLAMLSEINRFNKEALAAISSEDLSGTTITDFAARHKLSGWFLSSYLLPMTAAIWSMPPDSAGEFPIDTLIKFFQGHGLLGLYSHHQWYTVSGGSREYVHRLTAAFQDKIRLQEPVTSVRRTTSGVTITTSSGTSREFDLCILACHADQALAMLAANPSEERLLSQFSYQTNTATLHTSPAQMPKRKGNWASWNYLIKGNGQTATNYWMNSLQNVSKNQDYFVTIDADPGIAGGSIIKQIEYHHPVFTVANVRLQERLRALNAESDRNVFFCGSYFRYGFHEDALASAAELSMILAKDERWKSTATFIAAK